MSLNAAWNLIGLSQLVGTQWVLKKHSSQWLIRFSHPVYGAAASVIQQAATVRTHSDLQVGEYTSTERTLEWTDERWSRDIVEKQVHSALNIYVQK